MFLLSSCCPDFGNWWYASGRRTLVPDRSSVPTIKLSSDETSSLSAADQQEPKFRFYETVTKTVNDAMNKNGNNNKKKKIIHRGSGEKLTVTRPSVSSHEGTVTSDLKLAVLGAMKVGKTALVNQFLFKIFINEYSPTVEDFNWVEYEALDQLVMFQIIDLGGTPEFRAQRELYIKTSDAFMLLFSLDDLFSFEEMVRIFDEIKEKNKKNAPIQVVATKQDLFDDDQNYTVPSDMIAEFISKNRANLAEISVKDNDSVNQVFKQLCQHTKLGCSLDEDSNFKKRRQSMPAIMSEKGRNSSHIQLSDAELKRIEAIYEKNQEKSKNCSIS